MPIHHSLDVLGYVCINVVLGPALSRLQTWPCPIFTPVLAGLKDKAQPLHLFALERSESTLRSILLEQLRYGMNALPIDHCT